MRKQRKQVIHNAIAHYLLTDAQLVSEQRVRAPPSGQCPPVYILSTMSYSMEYPFASWGQLSWQCSLSISCAPGRAWETEKSVLG